MSAETFLEQALAERRLPLNAAKTTRHRVEAATIAASAPRMTPPVTYLGLTYDGVAYSAARGYAGALSSAHDPRGSTRTTAFGRMRWTAPGASGNTAQTLHPCRAPEFL